MRLPTLRAPWLVLALCAVALGALPGCDSGGDTGGGGDLRVSLSTSDVMIADVADPPFSFTNQVTVVATIDGAEDVTGTSVAAFGLDASLDSAVTAGPGRVRAYVRLQGVQGQVPAYGPTTLLIEAGGDAAEVPITVHTGDVRSLQDAAPALPLGVQLAHGREALFTTSAARLRLADGPAGLSFRQQAAGAAFQTYATATAALAPNRPHRALVHLVNADGWAYGTVPVVAVARSTTPNAAARVRTRSVSGGRHYAQASQVVLQAVAAGGALVTRSSPGGAPEPQLTGLRGVSMSGGDHTFLLYRDGRVGRTTNGAEREVRFLGDLDPADVAADGSMLMRDGAVWVTADAGAFRAVSEAARSQLPALPASAETGFVAITADGPTAYLPSALLLAASSDGRLWAASASQGLAPTAQRLPSAPLEMVTVDALPGAGPGFYGARLADGSVWTWRAAVPGQPSSLTAPVRLDGLTAARLFADEKALVAVRADGSVTTWGRPFGDGCAEFALCERPDRTGLREATFSGYVRPDGLVYNTSDAAVAFPGQPPLVPSE